MGASGGLDHVQGKALYRLMSMACGSAFMLYGWDAGVLGGIQATPQFLNAIGNPKGSETIPIIAAIYNLAAGIMALCVSSFGMKIGRKGTILLGCLLICIGALLQASTFSLAQIFVGRVVTGSGIGCIASAVPTYMVSHLRLRRGDLQHHTFTVKGCVNSASTVGHFLSLRAASSISRC